MTFGPAAWLPAHERDRGAASVLVIGVVAVLLVLGSGAFTIVGVVAASHRGRLAVDLAAVAAAMDLQLSGDAAAACGRGMGIARANGARMTKCAVDGDGVSISVEVDAPRWPFPAVARAKAGPDRS